MSERREIAKQARSKLAQALHVLQADGTPAALQGTAKTVAHAMGLLHEMENARAPAAGIEQVVVSVQQALSNLQTNTNSHRAREQALHSVANALGIIHSLVQAGGVAPRKPRPALGAKTLNVLEGAASQTAQKAPTKGSSERPSFRIGAGRFNAEAALGAHSSSNFYRGLSGNDVIEGGGIFVATYAIPPIGKEVALHVHLPGGYEFQAQGVVTWTREPNASSPEARDTPAGFGARFTEIGPEGRSLVSRYVANREPLFHDDC